ncbi:WD repeat-containing protein 13-like [Venturia canescens]|uniref:WD repeat-containing protein 13-like n=1 Tax=Venturia canescens TaxID=32260 RepID=UPI001C9CA0D4|nr:WD repeat-containing protein 13-like [Venturia canescens]
MSIHSTVAPQKMGPMWQQQVLALDAKYNTSRAANHSTVGLLYIRRRSQLLREKDPKNTETRLQYLKHRAELLRLRYGNLSDQVSLGSRISTNVCPTETSSSNNCRQENIMGSLEIENRFACVGIHHIFEHHTAPICALKFANNDRSKLCCASYDGTISICDITKESLSVVALLEGHKKAVTAIDWSISNDLIVSSSLDSTLRLWRVQTDSPPVCLRVVGNRLSCEVLCCAFVPANNNLVVAGTAKGYLRLLNVSTGIYTPGGSCAIGGKILSLVCEESGGSLMWAGNDRGNIVSFRLDSGTGSLVKLTRMNGPGGAVTSLSWRSWLSREIPLPTILVNSACNLVSLYLVANRLGGLALWRQYPIKHRQYPIRSTFCPQMGACLMASGSEDGSIHFLDSTRDGSVDRVNRLHGHSAPTIALAFNYDESYLATVDHQGIVIIWRNQQRNS